MVNDGIFVNVHGWILGESRLLTVLHKFRSPLSLCAQKSCVASQVVEELRSRPGTAGASGVFCTVQHGMKMEILLC